ncbi:Uncharacterised protein [Escherichia coli]|uniref:Uncharacterized protein n=1 Tax=Escherichia coli TaxID=562 RepID=A0A376LAT8_ECOLX|nr:Uncharacterised protein [Escherichia coli]
MMVEVIPLCRIQPRQYSHEQHIEELRAALARMLHMHHIDAGNHALQGKHHRCPLYP